MAKQFKDFQKACKWLEQVIEACSENTREMVAEQLYKDSRQYTYKLEGNMYLSGQSNSAFKDGYVVERTPYVRRRYYEGGKAGSGNPNAVPLWFEVTWNEYKGDYQNMCVKIFDKAKKEV